VKSAYVFVEGPLVAELLKGLLEPNTIKDVEFVFAAGKSSILSLARSLLVRRRKPVALFIDSDSLNPEAIQDNRESKEELLRAAAGSVPVAIVFAVPELETFFFATPELLERVFGVKITTDYISLGQRDPRGVLDLLSKANHRTWDLGQVIQMLDAHDIERIRATPAIRELTSFLQMVQSDQEAA
jgi:hypothetical protein